MLSPVFYNHFFSELSSKSSYRKEEFEVDSGEKFYRIALVYNKKYFFKVEKYYHEKAIFTYCPGDFLEIEQSESTLSSEKYLEAVLKWLERIDQLYMTDAKLRVINEKVEMQKKQLDNILEKIDEMPDKTFSDEESKTILERLEKLESDLRENDDLMRDEVVELKEELHKMQQEVELLKNTLNNMSKKGWLKMFAIKVFNWSKKPENRELISAGIEAAQQILPEVKDVIN